LEPEALEGAIAEMATARNAIVSRGPWPGGGKADAVEIMFDDGSDNPFVIHAGVEQVDRLPLDSDAGKPLKFAVYTRGPSRRITWPSAEVSALGSAAGP
jgi:hypothetical protein